MWRKYSFRRFDCRSRACNVSLVHDNQRAHSLPGFRPRNQNVTKTVRRLDPVKTQKELDAMFEELDAHIMDETAANHCKPSCTHTQGI